MKVGKNYAFNKVLNSDGTEVYSGLYNETATYKGIGIKTSILLGITFLVTLLMIGDILIKGYLPIITYFIAGILILVLQIIMLFSPLKAKTLSIPYAIAEGLTLGCICGLLEVALPGEGLIISGMALLITVSIFIASTILYSTGYIKVGRRFYSCLLTLAIGVLIFSLGLMLLSLILRLTSGIDLLAMYYSSNISILFSVILCIVATLYVIMSLSEANHIVENNYDKAYEWYAAYAITVNIIYLYVEVLRLLMIIFSRNNRD